MFPLSVDIAIRMWSFAVADDLITIRESPTHNLVALMSMLVMVGLVNIGFILMSFVSP